MRADPLYQCWKHICEEAGERVHTIYLSPAGRTFRQGDARRLKDSYQRLILVCGHYEGIDERFVEECVDEEISLGDFVLTGGEIPVSYTHLDVYKRQPQDHPGDPERPRPGRPHDLSEHHLSDAPLRPGAPGGL